jgi:hypothetical protein
MKTLKDILPLRYSNNICVELQASATPTSSSSQSTVATMSNSPGAFKVWMMLADASTVRIHKENTDLTTIDSATEHCPAAAGMTNKSNPIAALALPSVPKLVVSSDFKTIREVWIKGGVEPTIGHLLNACVQFAVAADKDNKVDTSTIRLFKYNRQKYTWTELNTPAFAAAKATAGASAAKVTGYATAASTVPSLLLKPPYSMEEGDILCAVSSSMIQNAVCNLIPGVSGFSLLVDREFDAALRTKALDSAAGDEVASAAKSGNRVRSKKKVVILTTGSGVAATVLKQQKISAGSSKAPKRVEVALKLGGNFDFSDEETDS